MKLCINCASLPSLWVSTHKRTDDFYLSSWQRGESPVPMLVVRLVLAAAGVGTLAWSVAEGATRFWPIYLTNWGVVLLAFTSLSALLVSFMTLCTKKGDAVELPWYISMYWLMFNITVTIAVMITLLYWILLFDAEFEQSARARGLDVMTHALNSFFALAELLASRTPVKLVHIYQPLGVSLWYAAFSVIYYFAGGTDAFGNPYVYEILYWGDGTSAGIVVAAAVCGLLVVYAFLWALSRLRNYLSERFIRTTSADLPLAPPLP